MKAITVIPVRDNRKQFLDLLLLADEQESMIDLYLEQGDMFALYDGDLKSVCVVVPVDDKTCELKNIATYEKYQGQGYGGVLIDYITGFYKNRYRTMLVGTGEEPSILSFYKHHGFMLSHRVKNFFTDNYDHPIIENGIRLVDMIYLKKDTNYRITEVLRSEYPDIMQVWEESVRATHHFLKEEDILLFRELIAGQYLDAVRLLAARDGNRIVGFLGVSDDVEMLFIHPDVRGKGIGSILLDYAVNELQLNRVDVNEQNEQALGFYLHKGFTVTGRSELDGSGKPYPILHMEKINQ